MKLKLNKTKLKNLSRDNNAVPAEMTPQIAGGAGHDVEKTEPSCKFTFIDSGCYMTMYCGE